jgi:hypothetical protein
MRIGITGATGFIGRYFVRLANEHGHECIAFSRSPERTVPGCVETRRFGVDGEIDLSGCEGILHLAGESVVGLWTPAKRRRIVGSRVDGTRGLVNAILKSPDPPRVLVSGSATGFYGDTGERVVDETSGPGTGFLSETCQAWEAEAEKARYRDVRVAFLRTGMVLGNDGGALPMMLPLFRAALGAELGSGEQWMAWIHIADEVALALHILESDGAEGPLNGTSPEPCRNGVFTTALADRLGRPAIFRMPGPLLRMTLGGFAAELLDSSRVVPVRTLDSGFAFRFPTLDGALEDLLNH